MDHGWPLRFQTPRPPPLPTPPPRCPPAPPPDGPYLEGERRLVTVLFADIPGFTSLAERMDPERLRDLMNACFDHLVPCVEEYGGTVDKFMGDAVMALFGAPVAHDNDAERAIRAALDMRRALSSFTSGAGVDLSLHIGINTGLVLAGSVGGGNRTDYLVMGDAVNVAASGRGGRARGDPHRARHAPLAGHAISARPRARSRCGAAPSHLPSGGWSANAAPRHTATAGVPGRPWTPRS